MYGYIFCDGCGAGFDAYEYSLPNGFCDRCEENRDLEPMGGSGDEEFIGPRNDDLSDFARSLGKLLSL